MAVLAGASYAQHPDIPRAFTDENPEHFELPLAGAHKVEQPSAATYYRLPVRPIYKTYPIYHPDKEPAGYWEWLKTREPEVVFNADQLKTKADWTAAGKLAFEAPNRHTDAARFRDREFLRAANWPVDEKGVVAGYQYVIRERGKVEFTDDSCASCHTRVLPDGRVVEGAQGNIPINQGNAYLARKKRAGTAASGEQKIAKTAYASWWAPWAPEPLYEQMTVAEFERQVTSVPPGDIQRLGTSLLFPIRVPDLIGVSERRYLDATGLQLNRGIADLMRYAATNQTTYRMTVYDGFSPSPNGPEVSSGRYSDEQFYALALYMESMKPPDNPNRPGPESEQGRKVFAREGCAGCHTPPYYTNNKLTPARGFRPDRREDVLNVSVGTDPYNALRTRRGTGYYKVPSLKGVWYRGPFEHNGSVATLEDWFDPARLKADYVPTGYVGYETKTRAITGHEFGLKLSPGDKQALIAFLKTL